MSNIRPIGDPSLANAMVATFQSIDAARSAPSGLSQTRWRILQCIAKAAPDVPSPGELRLCAGLSKAALAEHVQALQWKGLLEMGGYRLSPSAAAMVGLDNAYPPSDAKAMAFAEATPLKLPDDPDAVAALRHAISAMEPGDVPLLPYQSKLTIIGGDMASLPDGAVEAIVRFDADGAVERVKVLAPLDAADVPACMRPDCTPPTRSIEEARNELLARKSGSRREADEADAGKGHPRARSGRTEAADIAPRRVHRTAEAPRPARPDRLRVIQTEAVCPPAKQVNEAQPQVSAPPATPPKFVNWIEERARRLDGAICFLKTQAILVSVVDRDAQVRQYFVAGKRDRKFAEEVIEIAIEKGWVE